MNEVASVIAVAKQAGDAIMAIYHTDNFFVDYKSDESPVTKADMDANRIIIAGLKKISELTNYKDLLNTLKKNKIIQDD